MRNLRWAVALGVLLLLSIQPSLAQPAGPRYGGTLHAGMQTDPVGLDPHLTTATATRNMLENVYDTLVMISAEGRIVPSLAETWKTSEDGLTWMFNIRRNVAFHNGRVMTPEDVAYSINRIRDPRTKSPRVTDFQLVDSIAAAGASSVVVKL